MLANSLASYDKWNVNYHVEDLKENEIYPLVLRAMLHSDILCYAEPWITVRDAPSRVKRITTQEFDVAIIHLGIVEALPRIYPVKLRRIINKIQIKQVKRRLNEFESLLIRLSDRRSSWISPHEFGTCLKETVLLVRDRFGRPKIILVGVFHVNKYLERKAPGTNHNIKEFNFEMERLAGEIGIDYLDSDKVFEDRHFLSDRVHLNAAGHQLMASLLTRMIRRPSK